MQKCAFYVAIVTLMTVVMVDSTTPRCYVGTHEKATLAACALPQHTRSRRQSEITRPIIGNDTDELDAVTVPVTTSVPPANASEPKNLQNTSQAQNLQNSTHAQNLQNSTHAQNLQNSTHIQNTTKESTSPADPKIPQFCITLVANNASTPGSGLFYDCDYGGHCDATLDHDIQINYKGDLMRARCCLGDGCNSANHRTTPNAAKLLKCYLAPNKAALECQGSGWACVNSTQMHNRSAAVEYACQQLNSSVCNSSAAPTCIMHTNSDGQKVNTCCCTTDNCNAPPSAAEVENDVGNGYVYDSFDSFKWVVYSWVIVVSGCILAGTAALIFKWRRRRLEDDDSVCVVNNPRFQRLAANFTAGDTDDVKMLLADPEC